MSTYRAVSPSALLQPLVAALLLSGLLLPAAARAQSDTTTAPAQEDPFLERHSPRGALWRAAAFPGWGQLYNRQYYKIPIVYAGLGGITATALYLNHYYLLYRHAYLYRSWQLRVESGQVDEHPFPQYQGAYRRIVGDREVAPEPLRTQRDIFRRNRDLSYLGIGLFYGLTILDAYVSAHLLDFDVDENLTLRLLPHPGGLAAVARLTF